MEVDIVRSSFDGAYSIRKDDKFHIYEDEATLMTPDGHEIETIFESVADRILSDIDRFGADMTLLSSMLTWQAVMLDKFKPLKHDKAVELVEKECVSEADWTFAQVEDAKWNETFGAKEKRTQFIQQWLKKCTHMQLASIYMLASNYKSCNLAFSLACIMEEKSGEERQTAFKEVAALVDTHQPYGPVAAIFADFKNFELYYGVHLASKGAIIQDIINPPQPKKEIIIRAPEEPKNVTGYSIESLGSLFSKYYYSMLKITNSTDLAKNAEYELLPAMYIICDCAVYNSGKIVIVRHMKYLKKLKKFMAILITLNSTKD